MPMRMTATSEWAHDAATEIVRAAKQRARITDKQRKAEAEKLLYWIGKNPRNTASVIRNESGVQIEWGPGGLLQFMRKFGGVELVMEGMDQPTYRLPDVWQTKVENMPDLILQQDASGKSFLSYAPGSPRAPKGQRTAICTVWTSEAEYRKAKQLPTFAEFEAEQRSQN